MRERSISLRRYRADAELRSIAKPPAKRPRACRKLVLANHSELFEKGRSRSV